MGCITSTPKPLNATNGIKSQTQLMLDRNLSLNDQLRIIIDDDKYKQIQNTIKKSKQYIELSHSNSNSVSKCNSINSQSHEISVSSSMDIIKSPVGGITLMGFAKNEKINMNIFNDNDNRNEESISREPSNSSSEPSLINTGPFTLMVFADSNSIFVHTNHDLNNKISFLNKPDIKTENNIKKKQKI
eukprot:6518_1